MQNKICTVAAGKNLKEFLKNIKAACKKTPLVELRADMVADFKIKDLKTLSAAAKTNKTILTCRLAAEGGAFKGAESERVSILKSALKENFSYVDFELAAIKKNKINFNKKEAKKLIISYHDFIKTPSAARLNKIKKEMQKYNPAVIKIAAMVNGEKDVLILTRFLLDTLKENQQIILIGMGPKAVFTRVMFPALGSFCTYGVIGGVVAPGQLKTDEFIQIYKLMKAV